MKKRLLLVTVIGIMAVIAYVQPWDGGSRAGSTQLSGPETAIPRVGFRAPDFQLAGLDGKRYSLADQQGKPLVINFWASWCPPCRQEAPDLVKLYDQYRGSLEILAIDLTFQDSLPDVRAFVDEFGFTFPVLMDEEGAAAMAYQLQGIPTTFFVNREGVIVDQVIGYSSPALLASKFQKLASSR